jgi:hypothetical protein
MKAGSGRMLREPVAGGKDGFALPKPRSLPHLRAAMPHVVAFGELMLRLTPPGHQRFGQTPHFEITFGGAEANAASTLKHTISGDYARLTLAEVEALTAGSGGGRV